MASPDPGTPKSKDPWGVVRTSRTQYLPLRPHFCFMFMCAPTLRCYILLPYHAGKAVGFRRLAWSAISLQQKPRGRLAPSAAGAPLLPPSLFNSLIPFLLLLLRSPNERPDVTPYAAGVGRRSGIWRLLRCARPFPHFIAAPFVASRLRV